MVTLNDLASLSLQQSCAILCGQKGNKPNPAQIYGPSEKRSTGSLKKDRSLNRKAKQQTFPTGRKEKTQKCAQEFVLPVPGLQYRYRNGHLNSVMLDRRLPPRIIGAGEGSQCLQSRRESTDLVKRNIFSSRF